MLIAQPHPLLDLHAFVATWPTRMADLTSPSWLLDGLHLEAQAPFQRDEAVRVAIRNLLRTKRFKPTGRNKPASEYLVKAAASGALGPINPAVDACNVVSLHSGLPISVVDLDRLTPPLEIRLGLEGEEYVFNAAGQVLRLTGLLCLADAQGCCASPIKDSQRTKVGDETRRTLSLVWGTTEQEGLAGRVTAWYRRVHEDLGCRVEPVEISAVGSDAAPEPAP